MILHVSCVDEILLEYSNSLKAIFGVLE
ncbi:Protein CBG27879 [Caenorhabditis briggsae]|uniref:Protein CBG27879 n=1 Tax=Caenorhabditis briggsae TaxID=6238 RepID=B6IEH4_CAEBR|nr:Protein CBG27879 [Caenorhabditis briggsae]CAR98304.1 Protein CBG27879 [Caenorhabditis briggsae]